MIGLDTNVLVRQYIDDAGDSEAQRQRQRLAARRLVESGQPLMPSQTVILEFERVLRGDRGLSFPELASVLRQLLTWPQVTVPDREAVEQALANGHAGIDFADALHHASYKACHSVATFDDRKFAPRARQGMTPAVARLA